MHTMENNIRKMIKTYGLYIINWDHLPIDNLDEEFINEYITHINTYNLLRRDPLYLCHTKLINKIADIMKDEKCKDLIINNLIKYPDNIIDIIINNLSICEVVKYKLYENDNELIDTFIQKYSLDELFKDFEPMDIHKFIINSKNYDTYKIEFISYLYCNSISLNPDEKDLLDNIYSKLTDDEILNNFNKIDISQVLVNNENLSDNIIRRVKQANNFIYNILLSMKGILVD